MRKLICLLVLFLIPALVFAETIQLKSGKTIEGKIVERTDKYIKVDIGIGMDITYFLDEIENTKEEVLAVQTKDIKTAVIYYKERWNPPGESEEVKLIVYIDGNKQAAETFIDGQKTRLEFFDGENAYQVFILDRIFAKVENVDNFLSMYYFKGELKEGKFLGEKEFSEKTCKVYEHLDSVYYFWKGLMLKRVFTSDISGVPSRLITQATKIKVNTDILPDKFKVPAGFRQVSLMEAAKAQWKRMKK